MVSQHLSEGIHRISPLERDIEQYLIHMQQREYDSFVCTRFKTICGIYGVTRYH